MNFTLILLLVVFIILAFFQTTPAKKGEKIMSITSVKQRKFGSPSGLFRTDMTSQLTNCFRGTFAEYWKFTYSQNNFEDDLYIRGSFSQR